MNHHILLYTDMVMTFDALIFFAEPSPLLKYVSMDVLPMKACAVAYKDRTIDQPDTKLCAVAEGQRNVCEVNINFQNL